MRRYRSRDVRFRAVIAGAEFLATIASMQIDPVNKQIIAEWVQDVFNNQKLLIGTRLELSADDLANYEPPKPETGEGDKGFGTGSYKPKGDSLVKYSDALTQYTSMAGGKTPTPVIAKARSAA